MTRWTADHIPIRVPPIPGEGLDSWLEALARRLAVTATELLRFMGMPTARPRLMVRQLTAFENDVIVRRTGVDARTLTAMTLWPWNGSVVTIDPETRMMGRPPAWRHYGTDTRFCPTCLEEDHGRWQLTWRLPWSFACTRHGLLLLDRCPGCRYSPVVNRPNHTRPARPGTCLYGVGTGRAVRCGYELTRAPAVALPGGGAVLAAQREVDRVLLGAGRGTDSALARGQELYVLARHALRAVHTDLPTAPAAVHGVLAECGGTLPALAKRQEANDAHNVAIGTALAAIASQDHHPARDEVFTWLLASGRRQRGPKTNLTASAGQWSLAGPKVAARVLADMDPELGLMSRVRYGSATTTPAMPTLPRTQVQRRAAGTPAMLWPTWTMQLLPTDATRAGFLPGFRRTCASMLLLTGSNAYDFKTASALLGNNSVQTSNRKAFDAVMGGQDPTRLAAALASLARALDDHPTPIDYERRRATFSQSTIDFDIGAYAQLCRTQGLRVTPRQVHRLRHQLLHLLLGAHPGAASRAPSWYAEFHYQLPADTREFLHLQAAANLARHHIAEPVHWEPPTRWLDGAHWPGVTPREIDQERFAELMAAGRAASEAADLLGIGEDHLRLHTEATATTALRPDPPRSRHRTHIPRQGPLAPDRLRELYEEQGLTQREIAALAKCSATTIRAALDEANIPVRDGYPSLDIEGITTREWLENEYAHKLRNSPDIGRELGISARTVLTMIARLGIPRHPTSYYSSPFAHLDVVLSPAMRSVSLTKDCVQRLRRIVQLPGHRNVAAAARALGIDHGSLHNQLNRTERTVGFAVIKRASPLAPTERGSDFISEARNLLELLDTNTP
ncbi:TniQ family protein [Streptomyces sp. NBC_00454]|uniref:TniQ family protein n=1 Tax=Streptomyces sp. NBC_00454 TaxID=2975747 RepID=UPI0030E1C91D